MEKSQRNPKEGIALAAIVAKETTEGKWSGSATGVGVGTGGLGLFVGGASGSKREQTARAKEFTAPSKASSNSIYIYGPVIGLVGLAVMFKIGLSVVSGMETVSPGNGSMGMLSEETMSIASIIFMVLIIVSVVYWFLVGIPKREEEENERLKIEEEKDKRKENIYYRLRYVENDHVVFDPVSGREVPAEREHIISMINELASDGCQA